MAKTSFTTSFGRRIPFVEGYYRAQERPHNRATAILASERQAVDLSPTRFGNFIRDYYIYCLLMDFLESVGLNGPWERALDIGGEDGTISRLMKGERKARSVTCLDLHDFSARLSTAHFLRLLLRVKSYEFLSRFTDRYSHSLTSYSYRCGYIPAKSSRYWRYRLRRKPTIDRYVVKDFMEYEDGKYDFISAPFCLDYFELEQVFEKISGLLSDNGVFCFATGYWWGPSNSTRIHGHFPYAAQRLTAEDFRRYVAEMHPKEENDFLARYNFFHKGEQRPTVDDYVHLGHRVGLTPIAVRRLIPVGDDHGRTKFSPRVIEGLSDVDIDDVLRDIRDFRPDVALTDLSTKFALGVFQKRNVKRTTAAEYLRRAS